MATEYRIKEIAERSGFSAATLRYYEEIGILPAADRTPAGYRMYDDRTLQRLAFIARAKQLGCRLDEISELTVAWEGGRCGPVQDRLRAVVATKLTDAWDQVVELMTLTAELQRAAAALERHRPEGACDDRCGCVSDGGAARRPGEQPGALTGGRGATEVDVPIACTLDAGGMQGRIDEWHALLAHVVRREELGDGVRLVFDPSAPCDELMRLAAAEQDCCQFFAFAITIDQRGIALEVTAPADALPMVQSVFGAAA